MGGKRTTKEELAQIEAMVEEGLTCKEIAQKLDRSAAAIRNLRYKKHLVARAEDETKALFQQRDELSNTVKGLQGEKRALVIEIDCLEGERERLEAAISTDRVLLYETLAQGLRSLKQQRPELFYITGEEQIVKLIAAFLK